MNRFRQARDRGGAYLRQQQHPDGSFGDPEPDVFEYYKVLIALQACGDTAVAHRLCAWIRKHAMTAQGDFGPRSEMTRDYSYIYFNAWIIVGAHRLGQFDISQPGMDFLMGFWDEVSGGFYSSPTEREADTKQDLWIVSICGLAALYTGRTQVAEGAGRWLRSVMEAQPDFPRRLYTVSSRAHGLHTSYDPDDELRYVLASDAKRDQLFFQPGIAGGFLARLFQATGQDEWLRLARDYLRFAEVASDFHFRSLRAGKVGWAVSLLYTLTGEPKYKDMAVRIADNLIAAQMQSGCWPAVGGTAPQNDSTADRVLWLDEIDQAVGED